jgi:hypothetical protein
MSRTRAVPCTIFDHVLWLVEAADGTWRRGEILFGECLLLFTSLDSLQAFLDGCEDREEARLRPRVFSRSRKEFGRAAREAVTHGVVGALIDPGPGAGEAPFLQFSRVGRS